LTRIAIDPGRAIGRLDRKVFGGNVWYRRMTVDREERYAFADALAVGTYLNIFVTPVSRG